MLATDLGAALRRRLGLPESQRRSRPPRRRRGASRWEPSSRWVPSSKAVLGFVLEQLAAIVRCNAPMATALEAAEMDAPDAKSAQVLRDLREDLASGLPLWEAMDRQPRFFPRSHADMARIAERSGTLYETLCELATQTPWLGLQAATLWLVVGTFVMLVSITLFLSSYVVPELMAMIGDFSTEYTGDRAELLPWTVRFLSGMSEAVRTHWPTVAAGAALGLTLLVGLCRRTRVGGWLAMRVPGVRGYVIRSNLAHAARQLARMTRAGIPLNEGARMLSESGLSHTYRGAFAAMSPLLADGMPLASAMERFPSLFPASLRTFVNIGEHSGMLTECAESAARLYDREARRYLKILNDMITPMYVMVMAVFVLFVQYALYGSLTTIIDLLIWDGMA